MKLRYTGLFLAAAALVGAEAAFAQGRTSDSPMAQDRDTTSESVPAARRDTTAARNEEDRSVAMRQQERQDDLPSRAELVERLRRSGQVFAALKKNVPQDVLNKARCIAVFPEVTTAALVVGGSHGEGVAVCRAAGKWSQAVFSELHGGSLGAQVGAKSTDAVFLFMGEKAQADLADGRFAVGVEASAVAGPNRTASFDRDFTGVYAYNTDSSGAFLGASVTGTNISVDEDAMTRFYGANAKPETVFRTAPNAAVAAEMNDFLKELPGGTSQASEKQSSETR